MGIPCHNIIFLANLRTTNKTQRRIIFIFAPKKFKKSFVSLFVEDQPDFIRLRFDCLSAGNMFFFFEFFFLETIFKNP